MPASPHLQYPTIPLSGTLSTLFEVRADAPWGIWVPTVTSGQLYLQAAFDPTSANHVRALRTDGSTTWAANVGAGSVAVVAEARPGFAHFRLETQNPQAAVRSFAVTTKV